MVEVINGASTTSRCRERVRTDFGAIASYENKVALEGNDHFCDWQMGLAGVILGSRPDWWILAGQVALHSGCLASIPSYLEYEVAQMLGEFYDDIEAVRWMCTGSDPNAAAVKLARAITGRDIIISYGYHGTASAFAKTVARDQFENSLGTLKAEQDALYDIEWLEDIPEKDIAGAAGIFIECPPDDIDKAASIDWLQWLAATAHKHGTLFVLDEVVTGFRYGERGASGYYGLLGFVDLYCFGKTIGNGYPVSALAGKKDVMQWLAKNPAGTGRVHFSGTFFGEPIGLALVKATLDQMRERPPWAHLYEIGQYLKDQWNGLDLPYKLVGHPTRPIIEGADSRFVDLRDHLFKRGHIIFEHPWYVTTATTKADVDDLCQKAGEWR